MSIDGDKYVDFSLAQKDTLILQHIDRAPGSETPIGPRKPKKTRLKWLPLNETTTAMLRAIKKMRVERLHEYFEQVCDRRPHEPAIICGSSQLTYLELDQRANHLAHFLISHGVKEGNPVGVLLERSLDTYIALLGVIKAGAAFVPLDPAFSSGQVAFITEDARLRGLVTTSALRGKTNALPCPVLELDLAYETLCIQPKTRPLVRVDPASLCYITYTPSTTHQPVGVAVSHTSIVNFLHVVTPIYGVTHNDRVYQGMSTACGFSFQEIWPTWIAGATLVAGPIASQYLDQGLTEFLMEHKITALCCTPALLDTIERDVPTLRVLLLCGAACPSYLVSRWSRPGRHMFNTYGHAETTIAATCHELFPNRPPTLGSPLPTYQIYILDDQLHPVKDGEIGELFIGGPGVAIGYLNRPELTKERFIANPISHDREMVPRLYRTGDLGRLTPAGEIEYLGCINIQAKSRVYRTEPDEIEQLALHLVNTVPLNGHALAPPSIIIRAIPEREAETSKLKMLRQLNLKKIYKNILTDPLYKNSLFNMASTFILGGLGFVFWIIIARLYRPENVGIATTLISVMTLLSSFTTLGLNSSLSRYLPKSANKNELINSSFIVVTFVTILVSALFLGGLQIFSPQLLFLQSNIFYIFSFIILIIFCSWNLLVESILAAFRSTGNILIKNTIIGLLKLLLPFALIALGPYGIFTSTALALAIGVMINIITLMFKFKIRPSISVNVPLIKEISVYSFTNYISSFMFNMPSLVLPMIILNVLSAKYAAYYYIASMLQNNLLIIPLATASALLTEGSYNEAELKKHVKKATATTLVLLTPATAIIVFGGNILLQFFGKSYATESFQFLQLYSVSTIFTAIFIIANAIMKVKHQVKWLVISNILATVLTLWLSYAFISGKLVGIGWGWTLGQAIAGIVSLLFIIRTLYKME